MGKRERTLEMAQAFLSEVRRDLDRATVQGVDLPPRIRAMHTRVGHATPEYRTLAIPLPPHGGLSPEVLSVMIAGYARTRPPCALILAMDAVHRDDDGEPYPVLIVEARDRWGTRLFLMQGFHLEGAAVRWDEPAGGGWQDPGEQELILDASFPSLEPAPAAASPEAAPAEAPSSPPGG